MSRHTALLREAEASLSAALDACTELRLRADGTFLKKPTSPRHVAGTCLHVDMADAVNICAHVEPLRASAAAGTIARTR